MSRVDLPVRSAQIGGNRPPNLKTPKPGSQEVHEQKAPATTNAESAGEQPQDVVSLENENAKAEPAQAPPQSKLGRKVRKGFLEVASVGVGLHGALSTGIQGIQTGIDVKMGRDPEKIALNSARISTLTSVLSGTSIGLAVMGPVGLVVGGVVGYISGTIGNHLDSRSGNGAQRQENITKAVEKSLGDSEGLWGATKAVATGAIQGAKDGFKGRRMTAKIQLAGMLDGVEESADYWREAKVDDPINMDVGKDEAGLSKLLKTAGGLVLGVAGVLINAPGGAVIGVLESLKETKSYIPSKMTQSLVLLATNVGKFIPATIATVVGGPAVGTAVGLATGSVASSADGHFGVNRKILTPVENAVDKAHGEEAHQESLRAYYRAGKGAVVGFSAGVREGWKVGFQGGVDMVNNALASTPEAIEKDEKETS